MPFSHHAQHDEEGSCQRIDGHSFDVPIILCTGFSDQINEDSAKEMGISAFVMKPIVMQEMANTIRKVLDDK